MGRVEFSNLLASLEIGPGSWELGGGKWAELGRVGFSSKMDMVGELNIVIWEIDHLYARPATVPK